MRKRTYIYRSSEDLTFKKNSSCHCSEYTNIHDWFLDQNKRLKQNNCNDMIDVKTMVFWPSLNILVVECTILLNLIGLKHGVSVPFTDILHNSWNKALFVYLCCVLLSYVKHHHFGLWFMVFNSTFNNILVISWRSVLLVKETGVPEINHRPVASHWQALSHNVVSSTPRHERVRTHNFSGDRH